MENREALAMEKVIDIAKQIQPCYCGEGRCPYAPGKLQEALAALAAIRAKGEKA